MAHSSGSPDTIRARSGGTHRRAARSRPAWRSGHPSRCACRHAVRFVPDGSFLPLTCCRYGGLSPAGQLFFAAVISARRRLVYEGGGKNGVASVVFPISEEGSFHVG